MTKKTIIEAELNGEVPIPTSELGVPLRFNQLDNDAVEKAIKNGSLVFLASMTSTTPESLLRRRAKALGLKQGTLERVPTITRLANMTDEEVFEIPTRHLTFLAEMLGINPEKLMERRKAQRLILGLEKKPKKTKKAAPKPDVTEVLGLDQAPTTNA